MSSGTNTCCLVFLLPPKSIELLLFPVPVQSLFPLVVHHKLWRIWFLFQAIIAGYNYLSAGGDKTKIEASGRRLTNSLIGMAIVVAAYGLLGLMGKFLGVNFLEINDFIKKITPGQ